MVYFTVYLKGLVKYKVAQVVLVNVYSFHLANLLFTTCEVPNSGGQINQINVPQLIVGPDYRGSHCNNPDNKLLLKAQYKDTTN